MDNLAEESESFPNGFSTITLDHPEGDMHVFLIAVVTDSNTDGGKAEEKKRLLLNCAVIWCGYSKTPEKCPNQCFTNNVKVYSAECKFFLYNYYVVVLT